MSAQPNALRVADELAVHAHHALNGEAYNAAIDAVAKLRRLHSLNREMLEALKSTRAFVNSVAPHGGLFERINAAIAKAEGELK